MQLRTITQKKWDAADSLRDVMKAAPSWTVGVMFLLTSEQWADLETQRVYSRLLDELRQVVGHALRRYPMPCNDWIDDATSEVLLKIVEGRFLKRYQASLGHPKPYLLGSARQLARVVARSMWRQYIRDNGISPRRKSVQPKRPANDQPSQQDAA